MAPPCIEHPEATQDSPNQQGQVPQNAQQIMVDNVESRIGSIYEDMEVRQMCLEYAQKQQNLSEAERQRLAQFQAELQQLTQQHAQLEKEMEEVLLPEQRFALYERLNTKKAQAAQQNQMQQAQWQAFLQAQLQQAYMMQHQQQMHQQAMHMQHVQMQQPHTQQTSWEQQVPKQDVQMTAQCPDFAKVVCLRLRVCICTCEFRGAN